MTGDGPQFEAAAPERIREVWESVTREIRDICAVPTEAPAGEVFAAHGYQATLSPPLSGPERNWLELRWRKARDLGEAQHAAALVRPNGWTLVTRTEGR